MAAKSNPAKPKRRSRSVVEKKPKYERLPRPAIPDAMQRELWARAAGRCQFHGCNELLYRDAVSKKHANLSTIAHIVAYSPKGPRGDEVRSKALEKDIKNLMLTCKKHGQLIDNLDLVAEFPEATLLRYKAEHEERVLKATEPIAESKTNLLLLQARISGHQTFISKEEAQQAVLPRWPGSDDCELIDLNPIPLDTLSPAAWEPAAESIRETIARVLRRRPGADVPEHWSAFALAPIPLLVLLGRELTSRLNLDLFQHHRARTSKKWCWEDGVHDSEVGFEVLRPENPEPSSDVAILVSVTNLVSPESVEAVLSSRYHVYEIRCRKRSPDVIKFRTQLSEFGAEFRHLLTELREQVKGVERLHLFLACPAPIAIECGRSFIENADPTLLIYEYREPSYYHVLTIERRGKK